MPLSVRRAELMGVTKKINCTDEYKDIHLELKEMDWEIFNKNL